MSEARKVDPQADSRKRWTEIAYRAAKELNDWRVKEGQERLPDEEVDRLVQEFVEGKLASEAAARQSGQD